MRVMQVMAGGAHGGAETFFVDLVCALHRAGLPQRAVIRRNPERSEILRDAGVDVVERRFGGRLDVFTRPGLRRDIAAFRPDIVQTWMVRATRLCPPGPFVHVGWLGGYYKPQRFAACDHVVGVTPDIARHMRDGGWPAARVHYLPTLAVSKPAPPLDRAEYATPSDAPLLLALGRLHVKKAFDILLKALVDVPGTWLWIAGEGELRAELENLARELGVAERVRFLGWRYDREALLASADVCVFPSRYEPFGTVTIEAWAAGTPLVAAASVGPAGVIRDGEDALLVPVDDAPALAAAIRRVIEEPGLAERLVAAGRQRYHREFTEEACVRRYLAFYEALLEGRPGTAGPNAARAATPA
ncbi:MAG: glycosyltransferase [Alphaproteobacteria bacterium]|nr:MAG: glycosyltransferase [Alphaproteobacteria bacterium]